MKYTIIHPAGKVNTDFGGLHFTDGVAEFDPNTANHTDPDKSTAQIIDYFIANGFSVPPVANDSVDEFIAGIQADDTTPADDADVSTELDN